MVTVAGPACDSVATGVPVVVSVLSGVALAESVANAVSDPVGEPVAVLSGDPVGLAVPDLVAEVVVESGTGVVGTSPGSLAVSVAPAVSLGVTVTVCVGAGDEGSPQEVRSEMEQNPIMMVAEILCMRSSRGVTVACGEGAAVTLRTRDETPIGHNHSVDHDHERRVAFNTRYCATSSGSTPKTGEKSPDAPSTYAGANQVSSMASISSPLLHEANEFLVNNNPECRRKSALSSAFRHFSGYAV